MKSAQSRLITNNAALQVRPAQATVTTVDALYRARFPVPSEDPSRLPCHRLASMISQLTIITIDPTMAIASRVTLRLLASDQMVEFTVAMAPVASAEANAFDRPGTSFHGWLVRTIPAKRRNRPRTPGAMNRRSARSSSPVGPPRIGENRPV